MSTCIQQLKIWIHKNAPAGVSPLTAASVIDEWLAATRPPLDLQFFSVAVDVTIAAFQAIHKNDIALQYFSERMTNSVDDWLRVFQHVREKHVELAATTDIQQEPSANAPTDRPLLYRRLGAHPLYGALLQQPEYEENAEAYYRIIAIVALAGVVSSTAEWRGSETHRGREDRCCRAIRKLAIGYNSELYNPETPHVLNLISGDVPKFIDYLGQREPKGLKLIAELRSFISDALIEEREAGAGGGGGGGGFSPSYGSWARANTAVELESHTDIDDPSTQSLPNQAVQPGQQAGFGYGLLGQEQTGTTWLMCRNPEGNKQQRRKNDFSLQRQQQNWQMQNHFLPGSMVAITTPELAAALALVVNDESGHAPEALAVLISVFLGTPISLLKNIVLHKGDESPVLRSDINFYLHEDPNRNYCLFRVESPAYNGMTSSYAQGEQQSRKMDYWLRIPDMLGIGAALEKSGAVAEFQHLNSSELAKSVKEFLRIVGVDRRFTLAKMQHFLTQRILHQTQDPAIAAIITLRSLQQLTPAHYTTLSQHTLGKIYQDTVTDLLDELKDAGLELNQKIIQSSRRSVSDSVYLGSKLCPDTSRLAHIVTQLKEALQATPTTLSEKIVYQNIYTWYTSLFTMFATGYRAVIDPFLAFEEIDTLSMTAVICDKSGSSRSMARRIPVDLALYDHLSLYEKHRNRALDLSMLFGELNPPEFFMFDQENLPVEVRPKTLTDVYPKTYPYPINANRRYIRTRFVEMGVPTTVTDAFMGHWVQSRAPHHQFSSTNPVRLIEDAREGISALLSELGFVAIDSAMRHSA